MLSKSESVTNTNWLCLFIKFCPALECLSSPLDKMTTVPRVKIGAGIIRLAVGELKKWKKRWMETKEAANSKRVKRSADERKGITR